MISYDKTCEDCLKEMFRRVGEEFPNEELTNQDDWYQQRTWTPEQEEDFKEWMTKLLKKRYRWSKKHLDWEVGMFMLNWGWKTDPLPWEVKGEARKLKAANAPAGRGTVARKKKIRKKSSKKD